MDIKQRISELQEKIDFLTSKQEDFQYQIKSLKIDLINLKKVVLLGDAIEDDIIDVEKELVEVKEPIKPQETYTMPKAVGDFSKKAVKIPKLSLIDRLKNDVGINLNLKADLEKFIGTNLMSKVGILILVIGVIIGAKYAIDKDMISPLTRVIIGYGISLGLLGLSIKLKEKYLNFSAILLSGSLSMLYFLSFISFSIYGFISQPIAFVLMLVFTAFTVLASISYDNKFIAIIGSVGSYAIPFLLSNGSGNVMFLFSYILIVNLGILFLSFRKQWKLLYYLAFVFTWLIVIVWIGTSYSLSKHFSLAFLFSIVFYFVFYATFLSYKLIRKELFLKSDVVMIMLNSFTFYAIGYGLLIGHSEGQYYLGLFTVVNAVSHFIVSKIVFKQKEGDVKLFYLAIVMVLVFITIAIPVQLDGSWVTLLWVVEAGFLFWLGRTKSIATYELMSYGLMVLGFISLIEEWGYDYASLNMTPILNVTFLTSILASLSFGFMTYLFFNNKYPSPIVKRDAVGFFQDLIYSFSKRVKYILPSILVITVYFTFENEIAQYFSIQFSNSFIEHESLDVFNEDILRFKSLFVLFYTVLFVAVGSILNQKIIKSEIVAGITLLSNFVLIVASLTLGLYVCSELRFSYLQFDIDSRFNFYQVGLGHMLIRYLNLAAIALMLFLIHKTIINYFKSKQIIRLFWLLVHICTLWALSSEMLHWLSIFGSHNVYKIALTILWGSYSLFAVFLGMKKHIQYLRIGAIALFGVTLVKLFFYDLTDLGTIQKTIVFISVGILLLIVSFLYNKYNSIIVDENQINNETDA